MFIDKINSTQELLAFRDDLKRFGISQCGWSKNVSENTVNEKTAYFLKQRDWNTTFNYVSNTPAESTPTKKEPLNALQAQAIFVLDQHITSLIGKSTCKNTFTEKLDSSLNKLIVNFMSSEAIHRQLMHSSVQEKLVGITENNLFSPLLIELESSLKGEFSSKTFDELLSEHARGITCKFISDDGTYRFDFDGQEYFSYLLYQNAFDVLDDALSELAAQDYSFEPADEVALFFEDKEAHPIARAMKHVRSQEDQGFKCTISQEEVAQWVNANTVKDHS